MVWDIGAPARYRSRSIHSTHMHRSPRKRFLLAENRKTPYFLIESRYEGERDGTPLMTRIQAWQAVLSNAAGQVFGNSPIWYFGAKVGQQQPMEWSTAVNSPGSLSMSHLRNFLFSLPWSSLEPDRDRKLLVGGASTDIFKLWRLNQLMESLPSSICHLLARSFRYRYEAICQRLYRCSLV
jgi:uncharacterized protein DUF4038